MWATVADVLTVAKATVTDADIAAAQITIEILADVTEDSDVHISSKNARLLKCAVAYQAAWEADHPDTYTAIDVNSATQDGLSYTTTNELAGFIAPRARACINRLSWKRNRSIRVRRVDSRGRVIRKNADLDEDCSYWGPLY